MLPADDSPALPVRADAKAGPAADRPARSDGSIKSMKKMLRVLECFSVTQRRLAPSEIARRAGLPRATAHRIVQTLHQIGFLDQDHERDDYRLGRKLVELGNVVACHADLHRAAAPPLAALALQLGEAVDLLLFDGVNMVLVNRFAPHAGIEADGIGRAMLESAPAHSTAAGRAVLAFRADAVLRLADPGPQAATSVLPLDLVALRTALQHIRVRGYAEQRAVPELRSIAAPIRDDTGQAFAALSITGSATQMPDERIDVLAPIAVETAELISRRLAAR
jgi:DNA-binding IclR family transcriptional regulator